VAPVNRIPSEILTLIPDFWDKGRYDTDEDLVALTHVCQAWREMFISRSSLWTNLDCVGKARTRVYLERSKSLPLNLSLDTEHSLPPCHPFFEIIPHAIGRLKSLSIEAAPDDLEDITAHLSRPAPLLEKLSIRSSYNIVTQCSGPHSSTETSLHCARWSWGRFAPSYLGGTWSTSHRSSCFARCWAGLFQGVS
jgi:hypothetical protein